MLPGMSSKLDLENATMWHLCQEVFFVFFKFIKWYIFMPVFRMAHTSGDFPNLRILKR